MSPADFWAIIADIESHAEGEAFTVNLGMNTRHVGQLERVAVSRLPCRPSIVIVSQPDIPPLYLDVAWIWGVHLNG